MSEFRATLRSAVTFLLCLPVVLWSYLPSVSHAPTLFETIQDHIEMVEDHGHSHGFEDDIYWALHGHGHDVVDHDHTHAFPLSSSPTAFRAAHSEPWQSAMVAHGPSRQFRIERPPRA